jgi:hypothetical protein
MRAQTPILLSVKVRRTLDPDPDPSYLGDWTDDLTDWISSARRATTWRT